jgi:uncharacterized protein YjbI with pentapeptide repeats
MSNNLEAIITSPSLVREQWLPPELAVREVVAFERRFGSKHLMLACHAALPLILNPSLINLIHINFLEDKQIPWVAEADFLLSPLCRLIDDTLYEVEPSIREVLLVELENQFGWERPFQLAKFLQFYLAHNFGLQQPEKVIRTQNWIAQAYLDPDNVVEQLTNLLDSTLSEEAPSLNLPKQIYITTTLELLAEPLEKTNQQRKYEYLVSNSRILAQLLYQEEQEFKRTILPNKLEVNVKEEVLNILSPLIIKYLVSQDLLKTPESESAETEQSVPPQNNQPSIRETSAEQVHDTPVEHPQEVDSFQTDKVPERYPALGKNFSGINLRGRSFAGQNLTGADFHGADIRGANFSNAILIGANFAQVKAGAQLLGFVGTTKFNGANLTDANLTEASLKSTDFRKANLTRTCWFKAKNLNQARVEGTYLARTDVLKLAVTKDGSGQNFDNLDLRNLNLQYANLRDASFISANLSEANLQYADLRGAKLAQTQLYHADLAGASLTGAFIENWGISVDTRLDGIQCDYVYMRLPTRDNPDPWRKPDDRREYFKEGDFVDFIAPIIQTLNLYQQQSIDPREVGKRFKTLDFFHNEGIDPAAVAIAIQQLAASHPTANLEVVTLEGRGQDKIRLQAKVSESANPSQLSKEYFQTYEKIKSLSSSELQEVLRGIEEKDERIRTLEELLSNAIQQPKFYVETYQLQGDFMMSKPEGNLNISGVQGNVSGLGKTDGKSSMTGAIMGAISGDVTNTINKLPNSDEPDKPGIKETLTHLQAAIEDDTSLSEEDKAEALEQIKKIAEASQKPEEGAMQKNAKNALTFLKGLIVDLPSTAELVKTYSNLLPTIKLFFGLL